MPTFCTELSTLVAVKNLGIYVQILKGFHTTLPNGVTSDLEGRSGNGSQITNLGLLSTDIDVQ